MLLCIDCGNTNTVFSASGTGRSSSARCAPRPNTSARRTSTFVWFSTLMAHHGLDVPITECIISSTVPRVVFNLRVLCDRYFDCARWSWASPIACCRPPRVDEGTQVGPDRLVNTAGAFDRHGGDLIVVDFGTATTFDVVAHDGAYVGGVIAPGVNLSLEALHHAAAALPHVDVTKPQKVIGTNTVDCMQSGVFWGYVGLVRGICDRIRGEYEDNTTGRCR
jgi:type III pantothenate kinase